MFKHTIIQIISMSGVLFHHQIFASDRSMATEQQLYNLYTRHQDLTAQIHNLINIIDTKSYILYEQKLKITTHVEPASSCEHCEQKQRLMEIEHEINILRAELTKKSDERKFVETTMELQKKDNLHQ